MINRELTVKLLMYSLLVEDRIGSSNQRQDEAEAEAEAEAEKVFRLVSSNNEMREGKMEREDKLRGRREREDSK